MSEIKLPADSGGGSVSLKGPATTTGNAAVPFVLPVADGSAGEYLKTDGSGNLGWATDVGGKVLGYNHISTSTGTDCSAFTDFTTISNFALSYTPTASNSKLLFMGMFQLTVRATNSSYYGTMEYRIKHGSHGNSEHVVIMQPPGSGTGTAYTDTVTFITQFDAQDTNARDFEVQIHNQNAASGSNNGHMYINEYSGRSSMQVMEISA